MLIPYNAAEAYLLEVFLLEVPDGLVNLQTVGQLHVLRGFHLVNTPVSTVKWQVLLLDKLDSTKSSTRLCNIEWLAT